MEIGKPSFDADNAAGLQDLEARQQTTDGQAITPKNGIGGKVVSTGRIAPESKTQ